MAPLPIPAATRRFALASNGMTTTETAATNDAGNAAFGCFVPDQRGAGFVNDVQRQHDKTRTHDSQGGSLDLFMPGVVKIVVEPPKQSRTGCHFDDAVQAKANERDRTSDQPGDDGDQTFGAVVKDREVLKIPATAYDVLACGGIRHPSSG